MKESSFADTALGKLFASGLAMTAATAFVICSASAPASAAPTQTVPAVAPSPTPAPSTAPDATSKKEEKKEVVKTGVIASQQRVGSYTSVDVQTGGAAPGDDESVISGSVSRAGRDTCVARVINSGEKEYSVSFSVEGHDNEGHKVYDRYFSGTIKPKSTMEKQVTDCPAGANLGLNLKSAKALGK